MWIAIALLVGFAVGFYVGRSPERARAQISRFENSVATLVRDAAKHDDKPGPSP